MENEPTIQFALVQFDEEPELDDPLQCFKLFKLLEAVAETLNETEDLPTLPIYQVEYRGGQE